MPGLDPTGSSVFAKSGDRRAEVGFGRIPEGLDQGMVLQRLLDDAPLDPLTPAMNEADFTEACLMCRVHILFDDRLDVAWREGVEIERAFDRDPVGHEAVYVAVTTVLMPPRTEKSPTTVIRRGRQTATRSSRIWLVTDS